MARAKKPLRIEEPERTERERELGRYRIYVFKPGTRDPHGIAVPGGSLIHIASTPSHVEETLKVLRDEEQITHNSVVGIKDDVDRRWLINPLGKGEK